MTISVRHAVRDEWPEVLKVHRRAIHETAAADYPIEVLTAWGPPITDQDLTRLMAEFDEKSEHGHIIIIAEVYDSLAGFGEIVPEKNELLAIYVNPDFGRQGVGSTILCELERLAREMKLPLLQMYASLTAVSFYKVHGFKSLGRDVHTLHSGDKMDCMKMKKNMTS